ncbi:MAG TPA: cupin domain-containing protein [Oscillatoriales bacterium UBA8482]|nr:cupin domain-containing protein [Oscillatoriales bacterium UBA8482]
MTQSQDIVQAIQYQNGSVVSKEIVSKPMGTVTLFAFDKGQGLSEHSAPYKAFATVMEGRAEIMVSGVKYEVKTGEMLPMPAGEPHALKAIEPFKMMLTMIKS